METKEIDLTKCRNERARIRYRYGFDESSVYDATGYIEQVKDGWVHLVDDEDEGFIPLWHDGKIDENIMTFEIMPRDPETYKDWQVGDRVTCPDEKWNDSAYKEIIFRSGELVICKDGNGDISGGYTCGQLHRLGYRLVLTDIEKQIIEERKKTEWKPQDGDVCYVKGAHGIEWVFIKDGLEYKTSSYIRMVLDLEHDCLDTIIANEKDIKELRPATEEEKQRLFDAMAKKGKRWNAEKKVVEDIPKPYEFRKGEPVLVRSDYGRDWLLAAYVEPSSNTDAQFGKYGATDGRATLYYRFCLPYNEKAMHLLGTTEDYKEE